MIRVSPSAEGEWSLFEEKKQTRKRDLREFASQTIATQKLLSIF